MKKNLLVIAGLLITLLLHQNIWAQSWDTGLDIYSGYIWRGTKFGKGPALQPSIEFSAGGFALGAWGSFNASIDEAAEADLYAVYGFDLKDNLSINLTLTNYYYPGTSWMQMDSHYIEPMVNIKIKNLSIIGAYMMNSGKGDTYLEAALSAGQIDVFLGIGDGAYTVNNKFNVCNIGISTLKNIKITETFTIPLTGILVLNPSSEQVYIAAGISL